MMRTTIALLGAMLLAGLVLTGGGCRTSAITQRSEAAENQGQAASKIPVVSHGEEVNIKEHLTTGKTTLVDFYSEYCPGCMMLAPELDKLVTKRSDIAVVKVDVNRPDVQGQIDWDSPVVQQYAIDSLPHLVIFDPEGKQIASGEQALDEVVRWLKG